MVPVVISFIISLVLMVPMILILTQSLSKWWRPKVPVSLAESKKEFTPDEPAWGFLCCEHQVLEHMVGVLGN